MADRGRCGSPSSMPTIHPCHVQHASTPQPSCRQTCSRREAVPCESRSAASATSSWLSAPPSWRASALCLPLDALQLVAATWVGGTNQGGAEAVVTSAVNINRPANQLPRCVRAPPEPLCVRLCGALPVLRRLQLALQLQDTCLQARRRFAGPPPLHLSSCLAFIHLAQQRLRTGGTRLCSTICRGSRE